ncbi:hypothetical protein [Haloferula sp. BvORR071]|uniref:hypothetical protein n=1 Tax=Haloferula sp. BvORR071 TaxID=1396141 RepID=UPI00054F90AA|nr:hypothetical protein [Haloferula sp. BvORR071]
MNMESQQRHAAWSLWSNPIFLRYCRSRLRPRGLGVWLLIVVLIASFITLMANSGAARMVADGYPERVEMIMRGSFMGLGFVQLFILFVLGTAQVAGGMTAERDEGVIDYQRLVPMSPLAKVVGYLFGLPVREYVLFLATVPFSLWLVSRGNIATDTWVPVYVAAGSSTLLYHLTGLVTGTVAKNRRWAFLASIGLVFLLYTAIPQLAKFGLVFFRYLSVEPVIVEKMPGLLPRDLGAIAEVGQRLAPTVKFFGLDFSELVFTLFSQGGLALTFIVMLCRKWRNSDSHLLGKLWATGFFIWIQVLFLGNALPLIEPGKIFPTRAFSRMIRLGPEWQPHGEEAVALSGIYGVVTLMLLFLFATMVTPSLDNQIRGWRRARKQGDTGLPVRSDPATGFWWVLVMAMAGAGGWYYFTHELIESKWYEQPIPLSIFGYFAAVMLVAGLGYQVLLEARGGKALGLTVIFVGVVPVMAGAIIGALPGHLAPAAAWLVGISPASFPIYATASLLPVAELPVEIARAVPRAFNFWLLVSGIISLWLIVRLRAARKAMAAEVMAGPSTPGEETAKPMAMVLPAVVVRDEESEDAVAPPAES